MIVFGALFTAVVCRALGRILFRLLGTAGIAGRERDLLAGVTGSAVLSLAVFGMCAVRVATPAVFVGFGTAALGIAAWAARQSSPQPAGGRPHFPAPLGILCCAAFALYAVVYLSNSLAPEFSPDGSTYHLGLVARYFRQHGFERITTDLYANLSQGMEMLFLFAFAFGRHSAAATVHCLFLFALPLLMVCYGFRVGRPAAGACAAMLVFLSPLAGVDGVSAYNDVALATVAFALFYLLEIWSEERDDRLAIPIGLLAGFCFAIKYTGAVALLYACFAMRRRVLKILPAAGCMAVPWLVKNELWLGNPLSPFFNRIFPNPYIHVSFEDSYRRYLSTYGLPSLKPLFWIVTVTGQLGGQIGPIFLLAPLALVGLRSKTGRRCLMAAACFLLPYPANIGARFLIPALPFVALGIAFAFEFSRTALAALVAISAVLAWPRTIDRYRATTGGWQIAAVPWKAALHIVKPEQRLERYPDYRIAQSVDRTVPPTKRVWSSVALSEAYIRAQILGYYNSAESEEVQDILLTPIREEMQPLWKWQFTFAPRAMSKLRVVQAGSGSEMWSVGEARFFNGKDEVNPATASAEPFPWDIGLALDRNPVTRWRSWESIRPGMHLDFDFEVPVRLDRVELFCSHDQWKVDMRLDGIEAKVDRTDGYPTGDLRALATHTIKARGIDYLMIGNEYPSAADMRADPNLWGLRLAAENEAGRLYEIR